MTSQDVNRAVRQAVARLTKKSPEDISGEHSYQGGLGLDSLSRIEVIIDIELLLGTSLPEEQFAGNRTVQDTIDTVCRIVGVETPRAVAAASE